MCEKCKTIKDYKDNHKITICEPSNQGDEVQGISDPAHYPELWLPLGDGGYWKR